LIASIGDSYQWFKDDETIQDATSRDFAPEDQGQYKVQVTTKGCATLSAGFNFTVTAVDENESSEITCFPNPASHILWVQVKSVSAHAAVLKTFNQLGKEVNISIVKTSDSVFELNVANLEAGMYVLAVQVGGKVWYHKISIAH
jgi:hypothetical protein